MTKRIRHNGRLTQSRIYLGKFLRMFVFQNDWKVLPLGALIAALVTFVVGTNIFKTQEGTQMGVFALVCVSIWNGFFNSIQSVCREREIIKREHRSGLQMGAYIFAQMIYQLLLCVAQTAITLAVCSVAGVTIPAEGVVTSWGLLDTGITLFLITYTADMMALMVSSIVRNTTTAMTTMPFLLIFQLIFSGSFFNLSGVADKVKYLTISYWGMNSLCSIGRYNEQPMVALWNMLVKFENIDIEGYKPLRDLLVEMEKNGYRDDFLLWAGQQNGVPEYAAEAGNVIFNWIMLAALLIVFVIVSIVALEFIDRDKR